MQLSATPQTPYSRLHGRLKPVAVRMGQTVSGVALDQEVRRLKAQEHAPLLNQLVGFPFKLALMLAGPFFPAHIIPSIRSGSPLFPSVFQGEPPDILLKARAEYNLSGDGNHLNCILPYRAAIAKDPEKLAQYEQQVNAILKKIRLAQVNQTSGGVMLSMMEPAILADRPMLMRPLLRWGLKLVLPWFTVLKSLLHTRSAERDKQKILSALQKADLAQIGPTSELSDPATGYYIAGSLAEMLHNRPDLLDSVLNRPEPLNILLTQDGSVFSGGLYLACKNLMLCDRNMLWALASSPVSATPIHEFVHALTVENGEIGDIIPAMRTEGLDKAFYTAKKALFRQFKQNDVDFLGRLYTWWTSHNSTGIRNYAFQPDGKEFITTTLDAFYNQPKALCKTASGKELYEVYRRFFRLDPLKNYADVPSDDSSNKVNCSV